MNSTVYRIPRTVLRDFISTVDPRYAPTRIQPPTQPASRVYEHTYAPYVHACARHRQVLSNRRVLSIINVYRMRNRVQARPRTTHPPSLVSSSSLVHLHSPPFPTSTSCCCRCCCCCTSTSSSSFCSCTALSFRARRKRFHENSPRRRRFRVATRLSFGHPAVDYFPRFFPSFFARCSVLRTAKRRGWKPSANEGADGGYVRRIFHFSPRSCHSFFRYDGKGRSR